MKPGRRLVALAAATALSAITVGCGGTESTDAGDVSAERCVVRLHGKGGEGAAPSLTDDVAILNPEGNGSGWGARQWEYDSPAAFDAARALIATAVDGAGCRRVVVHGFSNGASMAAALVCSGERFDDRLVGVIVDDPVTDAATDGCRRTDVPVTLYWTGALDETAPPGTQCGTVDWTCDGGAILGVDAYAADLGVAPTRSPFDEHRWYLDSPLPFTWLG